MPYYTCRTVKGLLYAKRWYHTINTVAYVKEGVMSNTIRKIAADVDAKPPKINNLEVGRYKENSKAGLTPNKAGLKANPRTDKTNTFNDVPDKGFKEISVSRLEVGKYKANRQAGDTPNK